MLETHWPFKLRTVDHYEGRNKEQVRVRMVRLQNRKASSAAEDAVRQVSRDVKIPGKAKPVIILFFSKTYLFERLVRRA